MCRLRLSQNCWCSHLGFPAARRVACCLCCMYLGSSTTSAVPLAGDYKTGASKAHAMTTLSPRILHVPQIQKVKDETSGTRLWHTKMLCAQRVVLVVLTSAIPVEVSAGIGSYLARLEAKHTENTTVYNRYSGSACNHAEQRINSSIGGW